MSILAILVFMTDGGEKAVKMPCIYYLIWFQEDRKQIRALFDNNSKINVMNFNFAKKLGLYIQKTSVKTKKIDGFILEIFQIVIVDF